MKNIPNIPSMTPKVSDEELLDTLISHVRGKNFYFPRQAIDQFSTSEQQYRDRINQFKQCKHPLMEELLKECELNIVHDCLSSQKDTADPRVLDRALEFLYSDLLEESGMSNNTLKVEFEDV